MKSLVSALIFCAAAAAINAQSPVEDGEFPFYGLLTTFYNEDPVRSCGAAVLAPHWAVTEGYCGSTQFSRTTYRLTLGTSNFSSDRAIEIEIERLQLISHPQFTLEDLLVNNIALVHLTDALQFSEYVQAIGLPTSFESGYDATYLSILPDEDYGTHQYVNRNSLQVLANGDCVGIDAPRNGEFCASPIDFCQFHYGGVVVNNDGGVILGISNYMSCGGDHSSHITSIWAHREWIREMIEADVLDK